MQWPLQTRFAEPSGVHSLKYMKSIPILIWNKYKSPARVDIVVLIQETFEIFGIYLIDVFRLIFYILDLNDHTFVKKEIFWHLSIKWK